MAKPLSVGADGNLKVTWVPTIANPSAPTATELNAGTAIDLTEYLTADGFTPGVDEATISDERLSDTQVFARAGRVTHSLTIRYVTNPASTTNDKAHTTLVPGTNGYIVSRWGLPYSGTYVAAQKVDVLPVEVGAYQKQPPEANSVLRIQQALRPTGTKVEDVAVV